MKGQGAGNTLPSLGFFVLQTQTDFFGQFIGVGHELSTNKEQHQHDVAV